MHKLFEGKYKIKFGENDEGKIAYIDTLGNLLIHEERFIWNNDDTYWINNEKGINLRIDGVTYGMIGKKEYPVKIQIFKETNNDDTLILGELELIDTEKIKEVEKIEEEAERRYKLFRYSIFFVSGLIFILFFYTGLVNNNLISNKFLSNKIFKITSKIFNLLNIFLISLIIPTLILYNIDEL